MGAGVRVLRPIDYSVPSLPLRAADVASRPAAAPADGHSEPGAGVGGGSLGDRAGRPAREAGVGQAGRRAEVVGLDPEELAAAAEGDPAVAGRAERGVVVAGADRRLAGLAGAEVALEMGTSVVDQPVAVDALGADPVAVVG